ncbi:phosducin-like protein 3 [Cyclospora cayetanensis]|uniref:Phosducin-like protein 3 n=1 Tax=Cyclospora cayetanensis TaxID=88456 RepID=A0A6P6S086_9EIME|nr:phosducin-like protein 3 [Cyclospora cayetanensis]
METSDKLTQIATNIVLEKAAKDKFSALKQQQLHRVHDPQKNGSAGSQNQEKDEEEPDGEGFDDLSHWREKRMQQLKVCHFYSPRFERCRIMDKHLEILAKAHPETRIFKMNAEKAPFFSTKLQIRSLPTLVFFIDGVAVHSVVGFTELGGVDDFKTATLAKLMLKHKVCDNLIAQISSGSEESDGDN